MIAVSLCFSAKSKSALESRVVSSWHFCGIFVGSCGILWQAGDEKKEDGKEMKKEVKEELEEEKLDAKEEKVEAKEEEAAKPHKHLKDFNGSRPPPVDR